MDYKLDFFSVFSLLAIGQGVFLLIFLTFKRFKSPSYRLLSGILLALMFQLAHDQLVSSRLILKVPFLVGTAHFFSYCIGPLILLYVSSLINKNFRFKTAHLLHFIPFLVYNLIKLPSYISSAAKKLSFLNFYYESLDKNPTHFVEVRGFNDILNGFLLFDLHKLIYVAIAFYLFVKYRKLVLNKFSNIDKTNLSWMQNILFGYSIIWLLIPIERFHGFYGIDSILVSHAGALMLSVHIYFIAYLAFSQQAKPAAMAISSAPSESDTKYFGQILVKAQNIMVDEKLFLDKQLTLSKLSAKIDVREHTLSRAINHELKVNFFDYVNAHRVQEAKALLQSEQARRYTVEHVGIEAGFSSKATFYRAFKKQTGITPSKFQKSL
ncbi:MAG: AraC family transcriptional regulator [Roseivirga sp.]|nr:AraC family transcriptional regulator [Roseivirga sp.]